MYDSELIKELWASEKTSEQIAEMLGMNKRKLIAAVKKLGLPSKKPRHSMRTIEEVLIYKNQNTVREAVEKFNVSSSTIVKWQNKYNAQFGLTRKRKPNVNPIDRREINWQPQVNVLKSVPEDLHIPTRGYGW